MLLLIKRTCLPSWNNRLPLKLQYNQRLLYIMSTKKLPPIHPGTILKNQFLAPKNISQAELARSIKVSTKRINQICQGRRGITPDTAGRLAYYFNLGTEGLDFWINLQQKYERECWKDYLVKQSKQISREISPLVV